MTARKSDAMRFAEFVGKIGIDKAQEQLDVMRGFENGKRPAAIKQPRQKRKATEPLPGEFQRVSS